MPYTPYHHTPEEIEGDLIQQCLDQSLDGLIWPGLPPVPAKVNGNKGRPHSPEHRAKISKSMKARFSKN